MKLENILGALARGYCTKRNANKTLDVSLCEDMANEISLLLAKE